APLTPGPAESLFAVDAPDSLAAVFDTRKPLATWRYIYIHHSDASTEPVGMLADHFLIGNGNGAADGEVQLGQRWVNQAPAAAPPGAARISPDCISICLVGNFDQTVPTPTQLRRLAELTEVLQDRFHIPADHILFVDRAGSAAGIGQYFPITAFRQQILR
ncbi:MAG TPA: N-acetylmuramoyl-L-alanine amidase, partial [Tepidisphaeraceae bacterium]|nr:N-acetylmuramoyl-L-alanine amidase [Tepidisphaeraceae bacterium]